MSQEHLQTVYERLGGQAPLHRLVQRFYDLMEMEPAYQVLRSRHGSDLETARQRLEMFLSGWMGGPPLYEQAFGHPRLRARHLPFSIGIEERDQWLQCMDQAMQDTGLDNELRLRLNASFFQTADWMRNQ
jgi:hemoglobin